MKRNTLWLLAAALAAGSFAIDLRPAWAEDQAEQDPARVAAEGDTTMTRFPQGIKVRTAEETEAEDTAGLRDTLDGITEAAIKGGFDDFVERLGDADRNRIGNFAEKDFPQLKAAADQIQQIWKSKYNQDEFEIVADKAYGNMKFLRGEIEDPQAVAGNWPVPAAGGSEAQPASATERKAESPEAKSDVNLDSNLEKGREVGIASFPHSHGMPSLHASMIKEALGWRIDAPDTFDGQQLHDNLVKHLTMAAQMQDQWPADANDAAAMITHHVLMAVYGLEAQQQSEQGDAAGAKQ